MESQAAEGGYGVEFDPCSNEQSATEQLPEPPGSHLRPSVYPIESTELNLNQPESLCAFLDNNQRGGELLKKGDSLVKRAESAPKDSPFLDEASGMCDQTGSPEPEHSPKPQAANSAAAGPEENVLSPSFPVRLWMVVEDETFPCVHWNQEGDTVVIEEYEFQRQIIQRSEKDKIFQVDNLKAFVQLMYVHGFRRTHSKTSSGRSPWNKRTIFYQNPNFKRDYPFLVKSIQRKVKVKMVPCLETTEPLPKQRKQITITRRSSQLHHNGSTESTDEKAQSVEGPRIPPLFSHSENCSVSSSAECRREYYSRREQADPSVEVTSRNATNVPFPMTSRRRAGQVLNAPPVYPDYNSLLSLCNTCYSILIGAFSFKSPRETQETEPENVNSECKCSSCEQFKKNPDK